MTNIMDVEEKMITLRNQQVILSTGNLPFIDLLRMQRGEKVHPYESVFRDFINYVHLHP